MSTTTTTTTMMMMMMMMMMICSIFNFHPSPPLLTDQSPPLGVWRPSLN
jgi:hypothetical protein